MKVIIKQLSGSLSGTEQVLDLAERDVLTIGRDPASKVAFDPKDDIVSREHATLSHDATDPGFLALTDTKSRNGTFVNGKRITGTVRLQPGDKVQLGAGGPEFMVDTDPKPEAGLAPTREQSIVPPATRESDTLKTPTQTGTTSNRPIQKTGVGRETFESTVVKLKQEGKKSTATAIVVGIVLVAIVGGVMAWQMSKNNATSNTQIAGLKKQESAATASAAAANQATEDLKNSMPMTAAQVKDKVAKSVIYIEDTYGLVDRPSQKQLSMVSYRDSSGRDLFVFFKTNDQQFPYVPLLVTDVSNLPAGATGMMVTSGCSGSGFFVTDQGYALTNRHVIEPWRLMLQWPSGQSAMGIAFDPGSGLLIPDPSNPKRPLTGDFGAFLNQSGFNPTKWAGYQQSAKIKFLGHVIDLPVVDGKINTLNVTLNGQSNPFTAEVSQSSDDADCALIHVNVPTQTVPVSINDNYDSATVGKVWVLGYPVNSMQSFVVKVNQAKYFGDTQSAHMLADPDTDEGNLTKTLHPSEQKALQPMGKTVINVGQSDLYQLSVPGVGHGDSGGPVTDEQGNIIGLLTLGADEGPTTQWAVPIRYGKELLPSAPK